MPDPDPERWQEQVREVARTMRRTILGHRDVVRLSIGRIPLGPNALRYADRVLGILRAGGLPDDLALAGQQLLMSVVIGFAIDETGEGDSRPPTGRLRVQREPWSATTSARSRASSSRTSSPWPITWPPRIRTRASSSCWTSSSMDSRSGQSEPRDSRGLAVLATGHLWADFLQGSIPALLPFLIAERGYSYAAAGALVLASSVGSSLIQPVFGVASDRLALPWLMPAGLFVGGLGLACVGWTETYPATVAAVAVSGLGVAAFHPEGARYANYVSRGQRGRGMSLFSLGGNAGFALGPLLMTPAVLAFGLHGTALALIPLWLGAGLLVAELGRLRTFAPAGGPRSSNGNGRHDPDLIGPFARLGSVVGLRSVVFFGLQAFVPVYFAHQLGTSEAAGNAALSVMLVAGAAGTYVGGRLMDRVGRRVILVGSMALLCPLLVLFLLVGRWPATALLVGIGFVVISNFSVTVVMGQEYMPSRLGLASGIMLGAAIGFGGVAAAALGALADATSLDTTLWVIALTPLPALLLALSLPPTSTDRRLRAERHESPAEAGPSVPVLDHQ